MGLRGPGAKPNRNNKSTKQPRKNLPWNDKKLSRAERVIAFCEDLPITAGKLAGTKMKLRSWQRQFILEVYSENSKGSRPIRTAVLSMARKNGKTQLAAALALCHLLGSECEQRGEVYSCALTRDQAAKLFSEMKAILLEHPELSDRCNIIRFTKSIEVLSGAGKGSIYSALSADAPSKMGLSPSFVVYDELGSAPNRYLFDAMDTACGAREDPLMIVISTQAADDHAIMSELIDYGLKIQDGEIDDLSFHLTLYSAPEDSDPWNIETWKLANPALDDFRSLEDVERQASQAMVVPSKEAAFKNLILNQRISATSRFIHKQEWTNCGDDVPMQELEGQECYGGLDLSVSRDLTAFVLVFPRVDGRIDVRSKFFMPEQNIQSRSDEDRVPYNIWAQQGFISLIPGATIDPSFVAAELIDASTRFKIKSLAYDRWRIEDLKRELGKDGATIPLVPFGQGFKDMSVAVDFLERAVADKQLRHGSHPVMNMCAANATVTKDAAGNRKLDKAKANGRIDGLVALAMALAVAKRTDEKIESQSSRGELLAFDI